MSHDQIDTLADLLPQTRLEVVTVRAWNWSFRNVEFVMSHDQIDTFLSEEVCQ